MSEANAERVQEVLDVLLRLAGAELDARVPLAHTNEPIDLIAAAINMLAEELAGAITTERELRSSLEHEVAARRAEIVALERAHAQIERQTEAIRELSTPVIEVISGVLILPLIGMLDVDRGEQVIEQLLRSIARTKAKVAIIDITGVPTIDETAADRLLAAMRAARLLGTQTIVSGVSPASARAMIDLGVDISSIEAVGSLEAGLRRALSLSGRRIVSD